MPHEGRKGAMASVGQMGLGLRSDGGSGKQEPDRGPGARQMAEGSQGYQRSDGARAGVEAGARQMAEGAGQGDQWAR